VVSGLELFLRAKPLGFLSVCTELCVSSHFLKSVLLSCSFTERSSIKDGRQDDVEVVETDFA
jgi:hypothetical protein